MPRICLVDVSSILHLVKHSARGQASNAEIRQRSLIISKFIERFSSLLKIAQPELLAFAYDSFTSIRQEMIFPAYKEDRKKLEKTPDQLELTELSYPQFDAIKEELLPSLGYRNLFVAEGLEADDIIGSICKTYLDAQIIMITSDEDMYQLLSENVSILNPKSFALYTAAMFEAEYQIKPAQWADVKAYCGCSTDSVPGLAIPNADAAKKVRHIGEGFALKHLRGELRPTNSAFHAFRTAEAEEIIARNRKLTTLPFPGTPTYELKADATLSLAAFVSFAQKYALTGILNRLQMYQQILNLS